MKAFKITGKFQMGREMQKFTKEIAAADKDAAIEKLLSVMGSKHNIKRFRINIEDVAALKPEEISDPVIAYKVNEGK